ncbi:lysine-specific demethylase SE14-like isoform X1 [Asparagus officinalis]|nr:lysine-specific demethylase SE14-like isoform X1 [Asparagus officinalis]
MPDEVPGVTSPMVYIGMLFSWFAWHIEDHELHSLNFLHMGAPKTWYAVPGEYASTMEDVVRVEGYGGDLDRLEAFTILGEKTTLLSPEVIVNAGVPCCRLVQNPGEFVVTFPRAYHVGFSHGFNCGEAANFATPQWLKVAKEAAVRRAAMNHLPMLSHQQLLYMLTVSFISRVPRALLSGVRSSRLSDRKREEREILVKKAFLKDMMNENNLICTLLQKDSTSHAVLWEPDLLPNPYTVTQSSSSSLSTGVQGAAVSDDEQGGMRPWKHKDRESSKDEENPSRELTATPTSIWCHTRAKKHKDTSDADSISNAELLEILDAEEDDLPFGLKIDSGTLMCVACGILGYPFMAVVKPYGAATKELFSVFTESDEKVGKPRCASSHLPRIHKIGQEGSCNISTVQENPDSSCKVSPEQSNHVFFLESMGAKDGFNLLNESGPLSEIHSPHGVPLERSTDEHTKWTSSNEFSRPRIFCLQHAIEVERLLRDKGGAHVLIICHSDYIKIKAYIPSIAEEIGMEFNIMDVPLESASPEDLNLINISIDDGEHEEHGENWTSKLGVSLRHCMKFRKQSTSKQEQLTLALDRIFSDPFSLSDFSTLKWHSRRSRTPHKVVGVTIGKSYIDKNLEKRNDTASKHHGCTDIQKDIGSHNRSLVVSAKDDHSTVAHVPYLTENFEDDHTEDLFTVPISAAENLQHQVSWFPLEVSRADDITDSESYEICHPCTEYGRLDVHQETNSLVEFLIHKGHDSENPESQPNLLQSDAMDSEVQQEIESFDEFDSNHEAYSNVDSGSLHTSQRDVAYTTHLRDDAELEVLSRDNADLDASISDESNMETNVFHSSKSEQLIRNRSTVESLGMQDKEFQKVQLSVEEVSNIGCSVDNSSVSAEQTVNNLSTMDAFTMQGKETPQLDVPITEEPKLESCVDSLISGKQFVNDLFTVEENREKVSDGHSNRLEGLLVSNPSLLDTAAMQQKVISSAVNNLQREVGDVQIRQVSDASRALCSELQQEISADGSKTNNIAVDNSSVNSSNLIGVSVARSSEVQESVKNKEHAVEGCNKKLTANVIHYVRRRTKRKKEDQKEESPPKRNKTLTCTYTEEKSLAEGKQSSNGNFIRSPCEGLRSRMRQASTTPVKMDILTVEHNGETSKIKRGLNKAKLEESYKCDIESCFSKFHRKSDLRLHMQNRCIYRECRKLFKSHKDLMKHQRVHNEDRPLKCPWKDCKMSFKWEWARTEHLRIHTGERPYRCTECELTFRYVSAFSRHRRKTGHYAKNN